MKTARYIGGPLDGQTVTKTSGRWNIYRDDAGTPITTRRGDKEFHTGPNLGHPATRFYRHQENLGEPVYVHGSAWDSWLNDRPTHNPVPAEPTARTVRCRYIRRNDERCENQTADPSGDAWIHLCAKHLANAMRLVNDQMAAAKKAGVTILSRRNES